MKPGFTDINENEQNKAKKHYQFEVKSTKALSIILGLLVTLFTIVMIIFCISFLVKGELTKFWNGIVMILAAALVLVIGILLKKMLWRIIENRGKFLPEKEQRHIRKLGNLSVQKLLAHMCQSVIAIAWSSIAGAFGLAYIILICVQKVDILSFLMRLLIVSGIIGIPALLIHLLHSRRDFFKILLHNSRQFYEIADEKTFQSKLNITPDNALLFFSHNFVLSKQYIIGVLESRSFGFKPVLIPRSMIADAEYYLEIRTGGRTMNYGILACRLTNGNIIKMIIGENQADLKVCLALDYFQFPYHKNPSISYR